MQYFESHNEALCNVDELLQRARGKKLRGMINRVFSYFHDHTAKNSRCFAILIAMGSLCAGTGIGD